MVELVEGGKLLTGENSSPASFCKICTSTQVRMRIHKKYPPRFLENETGCVERAKI